MNSLLDNTAEGCGHRVVAKFVKLEVVKLSRSVPDWAQSRSARNSRSGSFRKASAQARTIPW